MTFIISEIHKILSDIPDPEVQIHYSQYKQDENHLAHSAKELEWNLCFNRDIL